MTDPGRILIVDNDAAFVRIYREIFEKKGCRSRQRSRRRRRSRRLRSMVPKSMSCCSIRNCRDPVGRGDGTDRGSQYGRRRTSDGPRPAAQASVSAVS
jgi:hypothetical protein